MDFSTEVIKVLDELGKRFGVLVDWTSENIFPYVQDIGGRIVQYEIYTSIAWIAIGLLFIIGFIVSAINLKKIGEVDSDLAWIVFVVMACLAVVAFIIICCQAFDIIKCMTIPETVWIEYIKNLTTTTK